MRRNRLIRRFAAALLSCFLAGSASAQLRIVNWNTEDGPTSANDPNFIKVLTAIGAESVNGIAKPIDLLILQEQGIHTATNLASMLNSIYGTNTYVGAVDPITDVSGDLFDDKLGYVWNTATLTNQELAAVTTGGPRPAYRGLWLPVGYSDPAAAFYTYSSHLKAGQTSADATTRANESARLRLDGNRLGAGANIVYAGDFNVYSSFDTAYQNMIAPTGPGLTIDPKNGSFNKFTDTQDPSASMNDRFDFQFLSEAMNDSEGVALIDNVFGYRSFGNNGTHSYNGPITTGTGAAPDVLAALAAAADHLPVVVDYQVPAAMSVVVAPTPSVVLVQPGGLNVPYSVRNSAAVVSSNGADELDFTVSGDGDVVASGGGFDYALGGPVTGSALLSIDTAGPSSGQLIFTTTSEAAENAFVAKAVSATVLDHANGSFDADADLDALVVDFGEIVLGAASPSVDLEIFNLEMLAGFTAELDVDGIGGSGGTSAFAVSLIPQTGIAAGEGRSFTAEMVAGSAGVYAANYTIDLSDEDLPGETTQTLSLTLRGVVVLPTGLAGDYNADGRVDAADYTVWRDNFGSTTDLVADGDGNGAIDDGDYAVWIANFGAQASPVANQLIPEPPTNAVAGFLVAGALTRRRTSSATTRC